MRSLLPRVGARVPIHSPEGTNRLPTQRFEDVFLPERGFLLTTSLPNAALLGAACGLAAELTKHTKKDNWDVCRGHRRPRLAGSLGWIAFGLFLASVALGVSQVLRSLAVVFRSRAMPWRWFDKTTRAYWGLTVPLGLAVFSLYVCLDYFWYAQGVETGPKHCALTLDGMRDEDVTKDGAYGVGAAAGMAASIASSAFYLVRGILSSSRAAAMCHVSTPREK